MGIQQKNLQSSQEDSHMATKEAKSAREVTHHLLRNRPATTTLKDIAEKTGLSESWVNSFHIRGDKCSASVDKVEILYHFLTGKTFV